MELQQEVVTIIAEGFCCMCGKWRFHKQLENITLRIETLEKYCVNINIKKHNWTSVLGIGMVEGGGNPHDIFFINIGFNGKLY